MTREELFNWYQILVGQSKNNKRFIKMLDMAYQDFTDGGEREMTSEEAQTLRQKEERLELYRKIVSKQWRLFREECDKAGIVFSEGCSMEQEIEILKGET